MDDLLQELDTANLYEEADTVRFLMQLNTLATAPKTSALAPYGDNEHFREMKRWGYWPWKALRSLNETTRSEDDNWLLTR
ncbi:hypothetical protein [Streptomyces sp. WG-D5]